MMDYRNTAGGRAACGCTGINSQRTGENCCAAARAGAETQMCAMTSQVPVMVYIVDQPWEGVYLPCRALAQGTLFPALDKPFFGKGGCCND